MSGPTGLHVGPTGNLVVTDTSNHRVVSFALSCRTYCERYFLNTLAGSLSNAGSTTTQLNNPSDIGFDGYQNMYVADTDNHRIQRFPLGLNLSLFRLGVNVLLFRIKRWNNHRWRHKHCWRPTIRTLVSLWNTGDEQWNDVYYGHGQLSGVKMASR